MAGSRKWFKYVTDDAVTFAIELDESNAEAVNGVTNDFAPADVGVVKYAIPRNLKVRNASYGNATGTRILTVAVLTKAAYDALPTGVATIPDPLDTSASPGNLTFVRKRNEEIRFPKPEDTGLNDGDAT